MLILQNQINDKGKRFFEYLFALSSLNSKTVRTIQDYEKTWVFEELGEIEGCTIGNQCGQPSNLFEIHKPTLEHTALVCPRPYPELVKWTNVKLNKDSGITSIQNHKKIEDILKESKNNKNDQQLAEWKAWAARKRQFDRANHLYAELKEVYKTLEDKSDEIEIVLTKGILKWGGVAKGEDIELPLFTAKVTLTYNSEDNMIALKDITKKLHFEYDLLDDLPQPKSEEFKSLIKKIENMNFIADLTEEWKKLAKALDPNGRFIEKNTALYSKNIPVILDESYLIIRNKKNNILANDLRKMMKAIDQNRMELPNTIQRILGFAPTVKEAKPNFLQTTIPEQLYFPRNSTKQQKEIIQNVEKSDNVIVQFDDKTVEAETVANIVSHYLTEGKKILITTQKDSPLATLKDQIPDDIKDLCVSIVDEDLDENVEIERAISVIADRLENLNVQALKEKIRSNQLLLIQSNENEKLYNKILKKYAKSEGTPIKYKKQSLYKYDVAKQLAEPAVNYQWIKDDLPLIMKFPLNAEEWEEFCLLYNSLNQKDTVLLHTNLPSIQNELISESSLKTLLEEEKKITDDIDMQYILPIDLTASKKSPLLIMKDIVEEISATQYLVKEETYFTFIQELLSSENRKEYWVKLLDQITQFNEKALSLYPEVINHRIALPKKLTSEIQFDLDMARERILSGKLPNSLFFMLKGKTTKYLFQTAVLNGRPVKNLEDIITLQKYLEYRGLITKLARLFNQNFSEVGIPEMDITVKEFPEVLEGKVNILKGIINIVELNNTLSSKLQVENLPVGNIFDTEFYTKLKNEIEHTLNYMKFTKWQKSYEEVLDRLVNLTKTEDIHPIAHGFLIAYQEKDFDTWQLLIRQLNEQKKRQLVIDKWKTHLDKLAAKMPLTAEYLRNNLGKENLEPTNYKDAFTLKKMETWLKEDSDINSKTVKKQLQYTKKMQRKLIQEIIKDASWLFQIERMSDDEKSALKDWKFYTKKIGAGKGKHAVKFIEGARKSIRKAQNAIPVWIMPIQEVFRTLPVTNEKFDVVILDSSDQLDIFALNVLIRGEKVILIGDEKGTYSTTQYSGEEVTELIQQYIQDIPNYSLYDGSHSIFNIAEQTVEKENKIKIQDTHYSVPGNIPFTHEQLPIKPLKLKALEQQCESSFEVDVLRWIISKGYYVIPKFKIGDYCIDFVIEGRKERLAVECDGEKWSGTEKYEENLLKREALEKANLKFWTVNGRSFYADQAKTMEGLWATLLSLGIYPLKEEPSNHEKTLSIDVKKEIPSIQFQFQTQKPISQDKINEGYQEVAEKLELLKPLEKSKKGQNGPELEIIKKPQETDERNKNQEDPEQDTIIKLSTNVVKDEAEAHTEIEAEKEAKAEADIELKVEKEKEEVVEVNNEIEIEAKEEIKEETKAKIEKEIEADEVRVETEIEAKVEKEVEVEVEVEVEAKTEEEVEIEEKAIEKESEVEAKTGKEVKSKVKLETAEQPEVKKQLYIQDKQPRTKEEIPKKSKVILTQKEKIESKSFSLSNLNEIPPELIQNVVIEGKTSIAQFLQDLGFEVVDYRLQDGSLWVVANEEVKPFMEKLKAHNISFHYLSKGNQTTKGNPAWYTKIVE